MLTKAVHAYLTTYAEVIARQFDPTQYPELNPHYDQVLVIPAFDESPDDLARILPCDHQPKVLMIIVVNAPADCDRQSLARTRACLQQLGADSQQLTVLAPGKGFIAHSGANPQRNPTENITVMVVDCCRAGRELPAKQGVGLARKIGCDLALASIAAGMVDSSWIHCSDSDVQLPPDYWQTSLLTDACKTSEPVAVALYPFTHQPSHENSLLYEISLRYYVLQLAQAHSPYAFHTIGSLLIISATHYAAVRGFPKRPAAEDFYLLNKLAKTGTVMCLNTSPICLSSRRSHRVPFGTGAAMNRLAVHPQWLFYHPAIFADLRTGLAAFPKLWGDRHKVQNIGWEQWWQQSDCDGERLWPALRTLGFEKALQQAYRQSSDLSHFQFFLGVWFDAFRTLKFVHYLRDHHLPSLPLEQAIALAPDLLPQYSWQSSASRCENLQLINDHLKAREITLPSLTGPVTIFTKQGRS